MSSLDEKLRNIDLTTTTVVTNPPGIENAVINSRSRITDEAIAQIKQAFALDGYIKATGLTGKKFADMKVMTGQEWNKAFQDEIFKIPHDLYRLDEVMGAAKRASGILNE